MSELNRGRGKRPERLFRTVLMLLAAAPALSANTGHPVESLDREWQNTSLLEGGNLSNRIIFDIDFEKERQSAIRRIWIAASDGLHSYDGYRWTRYGKAQGLPSDMVTSVRIARNGAIWIGTDQGAGTFDGATFLRHGSERGLAGQSVRRIEEDANGALWFCGDGGLARYHNGQWRAWTTADGLPGGAVLDYLSDAEGEQFALTSKGLWKMQSGGWADALGGVAPATVVWERASMAAMPEGGVFLNTGADVFVLSKGGWTRHAGVSATRRGTAATRDGKILATASFGRNRAAFAQWDGERWLPASAQFAVVQGGMEGMREAPDGSVYGFGFDCLRRWERRNSEWREYPGAALPALSAGSSVWFMDEHELQRNTGGVWEDLGKPFQALVAGRDGTVWGWDTTRLASWTGKLRKTYTSRETGIESYLDVSADRQGKLWCLGRTGKRQILLRSFDGSVWTSHPFPEVTRVAAAADPTSGMWYLAETPAAGAWLLRMGDRVGWRPVPSAFVPTCASGIHPDRGGNVWLYSCAGLHIWKPAAFGGAWDRVRGLPSLAVSGVVERPGETWFVLDAMRSGKSGLELYANGTWRTFPTDAILSWTATPAGALLFGDRKKLYMVAPTGSPDPAPIQLPDGEQALSLVNDGADGYWIGTTGGAMSFHPTHAPPQTRLRLFAKQVLGGQDLRAEAQGIDRFQPANELANFEYSWRVDDGPWSSFDPSPDRGFNTRDLDSGTHRLQVRARDNSMEIDATPAELPFVVHPLPIQERGWFLPVVLVFGLALAGALSMAVWAKLRIAGQARSLEQTVAARTAELQHDLTRREIVEHALRTSEERHRALMEQASDGIFVMDDVGCILDVNTSGARMLNRERDKVIGDHFPGIVAEHEVSKAAAHFSCLAKGEASSAVWTITRGDQSRFPAEVSSKRLLDGRIQAIVRDITQRERLQEQLVQAQKMDAIGRLAGGVAHDFNNLLTVILGYSQLLRDRISTDARTRQQLELIIDTADRATALTRQLLAFSRKQVQDVKVLDLNAVIQDMGRLLSRVISENVQLEFQLGAGPLCVRADRSQLEQVLMNLAVNARDAMPHGGKLLIQTALAGAQEGFIAKPPSGKPFVQICVSDTGMGMSPEVQAHAFEPFFTTKEPGQGTGLGLATVYAAVTRADGNVSLVSTPGKGTTFRIYLPLAEEGAETTAPVKAAPMSAGGSETILVVEDDPSIRKMVSGILRHEGYSVIDAENGRAALDATEKSGQSIDLVLTDVVMPVIGGTELATRIRASFPAIKFLFMSGYAGEAAAHGVLNDSRLLILKPFTPSALLGRIRQVLDRDEADAA